MDGSGFWTFIRELIYIPDVLSSSIGSAIGAFLGFIGGILLQKRTNRIAQRKKIGLLVKNIKSEVSAISESLVTHYMEDPIDHRIHTPCWDATLASGSILEFIDNQMFSDVINFYSLIKYLNDERVSLTEEDNMKKIQEIIAVSSKVLET